jgi:hypothetical protein
VRAGGHAQIDCRPWPPYTEQFIWWNATATREAAPMACTINVMQSPRCNRELAYVPQRAEAPHARAQVRLARPRSAFI